MCRYTIIYPPVNIAIENGPFLVPKNPIKNGEFPDFSQSTGAVGGMYGGPPKKWDLPFQSPKRPIPCGKIRGITVPSLGVPMNFVDFGVPVTFDGLCL